VSQAPGRGTRAIHAARLAPTVVLGVGLVVQLIVLVHRARGLWFYGDDFDFLLRRSLTGDGGVSVLAPHNEHWTTLPIVAYRLMFGLFGLEHYLPYALMPIITHLLISALLYTLLRRAEVSAWVAALAALVVVYTAGGAGAQNTLWDFQITFLGAILCGVAALVLLDLNGRQWRAAGVILLVLAVMCSGIGLVMVVWAGTRVLFARGLMPTLVTMIPPLLAQAAWYFAYGHTARTASPDLVLAPTVATNGLAGIWTAATAMSGAGAAVLLALVAGVVVPRHNERLFGLAASGLVAVCVAFALFGYSRSYLGSHGAETSRYVYVGVILTVPALAALLEAAATRLHGRRWPLLAAWVAGCVWTVALGSAQAAHWAQVRQPAVQATKQTVAAAARLVADGEPLLRTQPDADRNPDITTAALARRSVASTLPAVRPSREIQLDVRGWLQVDVDDQPHGLRKPAALVWRGFRSRAGNLDWTDSACTTRRADRSARIDLTVAPAGSEVRLTVSGDEIGTRMASNGRRSTEIPWPVPAGRDVYVGSTAVGYDLRIAVPPGEVTVCLD